MSVESAEPAAARSRWWCCGGRRRGRGGLEGWIEERGRGGTRRRESSAMARAMAVSPRDRARRGCVGRQRPQLAAVVADGDSAMRARAQSSRREVRKGRG